MTTDEFRQAMASARVVVVSMQGGLLHLGGQQTYLNAMAMGKAVIVGEDRGAPDYIVDGVSGLIVPPGDVRRLEEALRKVLDDDGFREALGKGALRAILERDYSTEGCMRRVVEVGETLAQEGRL